MVTISWSDAPAGYLPLVALVNDLDMTLTDPTSFDYSPFVMDPANPSSPATLGVNTLDNVEQVRVLNPVPGEWTLTVNGSDVPAGPQTFGVAANVPLVEGLTSISGTVVDADTGTPIANAQVRVFLASGDVGVPTDDNGGFLMYALLTEDALMEITATGYQQQHAWVIEDGDGSAVLFIEMHPGGAANVNGTVFIPGGGSPWPNVTVSVVELPSITSISDLEGFYELNGLPANELLTIRVAESGLSDQQVVFLEPDETAVVDLTPYDPAEDTVGPDGFGYLAVQDTDDHPMAPVYEWVAIDPLEGGPGIRVELPNEETPVVIGLPFEFAYYDSVYTDITANENGFFSFGDRSYLDPAEAADFSNSPLPNPDGPPATVAPFWEDFRAEETNLSYYDDAQEGRFIIEWYDSRQWPDPSTRETFQVILYDQQAFPEHGDWGHLLFQYADVNDLAEAGVGIEDESETIGITIVNDGTYSVGANPVGDESAIYFYRPVADLEGSVALDPEDPQAEVTITVGDFSIQAMGEFLFEDLFPGFAVVDFELEGYESRMIAVELPEGGLLTIPPVTLTRLDVPIEVYYEELNGNFENGASIYWAEPSQDDEIDEFLGLYRVYKNGIMIGETADLTLADDIPYVPDTGYWVTAMYAGGESDSSLHASYLLEVGERLSLIPTEFEVSPPWPNPFNPSTAIQIALPEQAKLTVAVYDLLGRQVTRLVSDENRQAGYHRLVWNATGHASGVYFVRVTAGPHSSVKKVMLLK
ncbi:hypothetical protein BMS3Bbin04_01685 [bacterium BMS3Bbin04]|nr:hypothetical protein BMS3Bbin04_01685 [bacterium BMS3Bbin04]